MVAALFAVSCTGSLPRPPYTRHPTSALVAVPYPPPPARAEYVPAPPRSGAVWIDGEWTWNGRQWAWTYGRWVVVPPDAVYAPWVTTRDRAGNLFFAKGAWRDTRGREVAAPVALALGRATEEDVPVPEGSTEEVAPNVKPEGAPGGRARQAVPAPRAVPTVERSFFGATGAPELGAGASGAPAEQGGAAPATDKAQRPVEGGRPR